MSEQLTSLTIPLHEEAQVIDQFTRLSVAIEMAGGVVMDPSDPIACQLVARFIANHTGTNPARWLAHDLDIQASLVTWTNELGKL